MRRVTSTACVILLSLLMGGWGGVLAAAFCPHAGGAVAQAVEEDRSCHRAEVKTHKASHHGPHRNAAGLRGEGAAVAQRAGTCGHCASQGGAPGAVETRELNQKKRDAGAGPAPPQAVTEPNTALHTQRFTATQHAPPGAYCQRHLLLSVFLI